MILERESGNSLKGIWIRLEVMFSWKSSPGWDRHLGSNFGTSVCKEGRRRKQERKRERENQCQLCLGVSSPPGALEPKWHGSVVWSWAKATNSLVLLFVFIHVTQSWDAGSRGKCWVKWKFEAEICIDRVLSWPCSAVGQQTFMEGRPGESSQHLHRSPLEKNSEDWIAPFFPFLLTHWNITDNPNTISIIRFFQAFYVNHKHRWPTWLTMWFTTLSRSFIQVFYNLINYDRSPQPFSPRKQSKNPSCFLDQK